MLQAALWLQVLACTAAAAAAGHLTSLPDAAAWRLLEWTCHLLQD